MTKAIALAIGLFAAGCVTDVSGTTDPSESDPSGGTGHGTTAGPTGAGYAWVAGNFGACSVPCGGGVQIRDVSCVAGDGSLAPDSSCKDPKPEGMQACNSVSCSTTSCTPTFNNVNPTQMVATSPASGDGPLTVTLDMGVVSNFVWDYIDFGDGTTFDGTGLTYTTVELNGNPNDKGDFACVSHTFITPGTYSVGRAQTGGDLHVEVTVTVQ